jgi:hypothetical protein
MSLAVLFWLLMIIFFLLYTVAWVQPANPYYGRGYPIILALLLAVLGWAVFGPMVHG